MEHMKHQIDIPEEESALRIPNLAPLNLEPALKASAPVRKVTRMTDDAVLSFMIDGKDMKE